MLHATGYDVVDGSPAPAKTSEEYLSRKNINVVVLQWIYGTLLARVLEEKSTANEAWLGVKNLFLNYKGFCVASLQHEPTNLTLAAMLSLKAYCQHKRELSDRLTAVDCHINNTQHITHLVHGLPREYDTATSVLNKSLQSWEEECNKLQSEARCIVAPDAVTPTPIVAVVVNTPSERPRDQQPTSNQDFSSSNQDNQGLSQNNRDSQSHREPQKYGWNRGPAQQK
ncbi:hypothetical protein Hdeb2414_s0320g00866721 [Helianthus debilis subsp. tardiflorus]